MTLLDMLTDSSALRISRFPDIDRFRSIERLAEARSIPLDLTNFTPGFATVALKSCSIYLQRTFPRILQAQYRTSGAIVAFAMSEPASVVLNGTKVQPPSLLLISGSTLCDMVEPQANLIAFVQFHAMHERGWPLVANAVQPLAVNRQALRALQWITRSILLLASNEPERFAGAVDAMEESLFEAVDHILLAEEWGLVAWRPNLSSYLALVRRLDELLLQNAETVVYSADIAQRLGVSVRTVHNAVVAIRGMSLHRYCRLQRLWKARHQLVFGSAIARVKAIAFANGFWHMGEFAQHYRAAFGETPQQTQQRRY